MRDASHPFGGHRGTGFARTPSNILVGPILVVQAYRWAGVQNRFCRRIPPSSGRDAVGMHRGSYASRCRTSGLAPSPRARMKRGSQSALGPAPRGDLRGPPRLLGGEFFEGSGEHRRHRSDIDSRCILRHDSDRRELGLRAVLARCSRRAHSGMFPCFFAGRLARLVRRARSALTTATRVAAGSITPSSSPRSAARNGDATL